MEHGEQSSTTGTAAADAPEQEGEGRVRALLVCLGVLVASIVGYVAWAAVLYVVALPFVSGELSDLQVALLDPVALGLGFGSGVAAYLAYSHYDSSFLDVSVPTPRELAYVVAGVAALLALNYGAEFLYGVFAIPQPEHSTIETIAGAGPIVGAYYVVVALVFIGPGEELLFRNVFQKRLTPSFGWIGAVLASSAVFAVAHSAAYWNADPLQLGGALVTVFTLSVVLGTIYERTRNLPVVALIHGGYDAVLFAIVALG